MKIYRILYITLLFISISCPVLANQEHTYTTIIAGRKCVWETQGLSKVTAACILDASRRFSVPVAAILTIMDVEKGVVGMWLKNSNNTGDIGPMQINTCHLPKLAPYGISQQDVQKNGCLNVIVGTWLLRQHMDNSNNLFEAMGRYHSMTPHYKRRYQGYIVNAYSKLKENPGKHIERILQKSNEIFIQK